MKILRHAIVGSLAAALTTSALATGAGLDLAAVLEQLQGHDPAAVLSIEAEGDSIEIRYLIGGQTVTRTARVDAGSVYLELSQPPPRTRHTSRRLTEALSGPRLNLIDLVRKAQVLSPGFHVLEAEYELEDGRLIAELELADSGTTLELELDAQTGAVLEIEREDEDDDEDDEDDEDED